MEQPKKELRGMDPVVDLANLPAPTAVSFALFSRLNDEISMVLGSVNLPAAIAKLREGPEPNERGIVEVPAQATHYVHMTIGGFAGLHKRVNEFADSLRKSGIELKSYEDL